MSLQRPLDTARHIPMLPLRDKCLNLQLSNLFLTIGSYTDTETCLSNSYTFTGVNLSAVADSLSLNIQVMNKFSASWKALKLES